jgi:hypothetical protein
MEQVGGAAVSREQKLRGEIIRFVFANCGDAITGKRFFAMDSTKFDDIDQVLAFARSVPEFPNKALVVSRLETRNLNRFQEAILVVNESIVNAEAQGESTETLVALLNRIEKLEANDKVADQG